MALSTLKTIYGFLLTMLEKYTPVKTSKCSITGIYNYLPINGLVTTSGQPTEEQFELIRDQGFKTVINLAPHDAENALRDEAATLQSLGLEYIHIPVNFSRPSERKFAMFIEAMQGYQGKHTWVHCAANMRVSAFIYRYRLTILNQDKSVAKRDLHKIWKPYGVWKEFINKA